MTSVFAHGQLRLFLLALLAEGPRHGYEVIQLLADRFDGLYSPSAGTIYPRLAKLEEEGLVARTADGRKATYQITDAGRAEVAARAQELSDLRADLDQSVRRLAQQVQATVHGRSADLRAELAQAAKAARASAREPGRHTPEAARAGGASAEEFAEAIVRGAWSGWLRHGVSPAQSAAIAEIIADASRRIATVLRQQD